MSFNSEFYIEDGVLIKYNGTEDCVVIPDTVKIIGSRAFENHEHMSTAVIPDSVERICEYAFYACKRLVTVEFPDRELVIENGAFGESWDLEELIVIGEQRCLKVENGVLYSADGTELILYPAGRQSSLFAIPNGVERICNGAFYSCNQLGWVEIPDTVTHIGKSAFHSCYSLKGIAIPPSVTLVDDWAFSYCGNLNRVHIPDGEVRFGTGAFCGCAS